MYLNYAIATIGYFRFILRFNNLLAHQYNLLG